MDEWFGPFRLNTLAAPLEERDEDISDVGWNIPIPDVPESSFHGLEALLGATGGTCEEFAADDSESIGEQFGPFVVRLDSPPDPEEEYEDAEDAWTIPIPDIPQTAFGGLEVLIGTSHGIDDEPDDESSAEQFGPFLVRLDLPPDPEEECIQEEDSYVHTSIPVQTILQASDTDFERLLVSLSTSGAIRKRRVDGVTPPEAISKNDLSEVVRFVKDVALWLVWDEKLYFWDETHWQVLSLPQTVRVLRTLLLGVAGGNFLPYSAYKEIFQQLITDPELEKSSAFNPPEHMLNCRDGILDLSGPLPQVVASAPEYDFTSYIDVSVEDILSPSAFGTTFETYVARAGNGDPTFRRMVLEMILRLVLNINAKVFYYLVGYSNTGKSVLLNLLVEIVGRSLAHPIKKVNTLGSRFQTHFLAGKKLCYCDEIPDEPFTADSCALLKALCGKAGVNAEIKGGQEYTIYDKPLIVFAGNAPLRVDAQSFDKGLQNRLVIIPFVGEPIAEQDQSRDIGEELLEELPYILSEAIKLYPELAAFDFNKPFRMAVPDEFDLLEQSDDYRIIQDYIEQRLIYCPGNRITTEEIYLDYCAHATQSIGKQTFSRLLAVQIKKAIPDVKTAKLNGGTARGYLDLGFGNSDSALP